MSTQERSNVGPIIGGAACAAGVVVLTVWIEQALSDRLGNALWVYAVLAILAGFGLYAAWLAGVLVFGKLRGNKRGEGNEHAR